MKMPASIMAVAHNPRNLQLLTEFLRRAGRATVSAATLEQVDALLAEDSQVALSLALVDLGGFDQGMWERCDRLRARGVPFLVISSSTTNALSLNSIRHGARGILTKPLSSQALLKLIHELVEG